VKIDEMRFSTAPGVITSARPIMSGRTMPPGLGAESASTQPVGRRTGGGAGPTRV
jgi:hypothetical protein